MRKGSHHTPEAREKLRQASLGRPGYWTGKHHSLDTCDKIRESNLGKVLSESTVEKIRLAVTGRPVSDVTREKIRQAHLGTHLSLATIEKLRKIRRGTHHTLATRKKIEALWQSPEYVQKQMRARNVAPNKAEMVFLDILDEIDPGNWIYVGDGQLIVAGKCPDFVHRTKKLIIELFGDYWHTPEETKPRTALFEKHGYQVLIVWEHELHNVEGLIGQLQGFINVTI